MSKRMLIDASHPEETRVVVLDGNTVDEFDFEAASRRPLKGNIYLAKVTRVEPSLQAAFVEYGGNRQGFLAFSEIHPDYYQIPVADRLALLAQQAERLAAEEAAENEEIAAAEKGEQLSENSEEHFSDEASAEGQSPDAFSGDEHGHAHDEHPHSDHSTAEHAQDDHERDDRREEFSSDPTEEGEDHAEHPRIAVDEIETFAAVAEQISGSNDDDGDGPDEQGRPDSGFSEDAAPENDGTSRHGVSTTAETSAAAQMESTGVHPMEQRAGQPFHRPRGPRRRPYKIQEVIKRRQIMLVQVVKEERGTKGAALTTFLSLAGRYCVLMPNTPRGGGISRKITNVSDRRRLKAAAQGLELPQGMGLIIRTAGANRTKVEIKRDYEYLLRLWDSVRELTLRSNAPSLVYEEGNLIKRSIRDLYNKDISEIVVDGDGGYRDAKEFMRMLMPSHAKNIKPYKDVIPLFQRYHVDAQLDAMFSSTVTLKSGGYIVINQTEALVAIDVNSGKATREHSIEDTAYKTNLEAASEIARQLRLRDLAGLIVIDFIDMEDGRNDRNVEKRLRDALRDDRARVQIGKISQFGLLEMSRQRLRAGVVAGSTIPCPHCGGQGIVRSTESAALRLLRALEEEAQSNQSSDLKVQAPNEVVIYTLNQKRRELSRIEEAYDVMVTFEPQASMIGGGFEIERTAVRTPTQRPRPVPELNTLHDIAEGAATDVTLAEVPEHEMIEEAVDHDAEESLNENGHVGGDEMSGSEYSSNPTQSGQQGDGRRRKRRRRGGRNRQGNQQPLQNGNHGGHNQSREGHSHEEIPPRDIQNPQSDANEAPDAYAQGNEDNRQNFSQPQQPFQNRQGDGQAPHDGGRRRRRRRRGRHRRHDNQGNYTNNPQFAASGQQDAGPSGSGQQDPAPAPDAFGQNDANYDSAYRPNEPSSPEWSFGQKFDAAPARHVEQTQRENYSAPIDAPAPAYQAPMSEKNEAVPEDKMDAGEDAKPTRKGWWQRRFKLGE